MACPESPRPRVLICCPPSPPEPALLSLPVPLHFLIPGIPHSGALPVQPRPLMSVCALTGCSALSVVSGLLSRVHPPPPTTFQVTLFVGRAMNIYEGPTVCHALWATRGVRSKQNRPNSMSDGSTGSINKQIAHFLFYSKCAGNL